MKQSEMKARVLKLRGKKSLRLIADELGVSRNIVAGLFFRASHPGQNKTGAGRGMVRGKRAKKHMPLGAAPGSERRHGVRKALDDIIAICSKPGASHIRQDVLKIAIAACKYADTRREEKRAEAARARALA